MKDRLYILLFFLAFAVRAAAADTLSVLQPDTLQPRYALKTNALYLGALTFNLEGEVKVGRQSTLSTLIAYNPWRWREDRMLRALAVQPEYRYWTCEPYEGHFFAAHIHGAKFNAAFSGLHRDGWLAGAGIGYGYDWIVSPHWNIEAEIAVGWARLWWKEWPIAKCTQYVHHKHYDYFGPTKVALSIGYVF